MPLTEPDLWISHIRLFTDTLFNSHIKFTISAIRRCVVSIVFSNSEIGLCLTSPLRINANPFECPETSDLTGHYPCYSSTMS